MGGSLNPHVAADAVGADRLLHDRLQVRLGVEPDPVRTAEDAHVDPDLPLVVEERGVGFSVPFPLFGGNLQVSMEHGVAERFFERDADPDDVRLIA